MRTHRHIYGLIILSLSTLGFILSCNADGPGIFYSIDRQVKLNDSDISELKVRQVLEVGERVYARTGGIVWEYDSNDEDWKKIADSKAGSLTNDGTDLYALFYTEDLTESSLKKHGGSDKWNEE
ncbi:MAG: hypothetical protein ACLFNZ_02825, partial [Spirochaetaceae bacterium]